MTTKHRCAFCGVSQDDCDVMLVDPQPGTGPTICGDCVRYAATIMARSMAEKAVRAAEKQILDLLGPAHRKGHPELVGEAP